RVSPGVPSRPPRPAPGSPASRTPAAAPAAGCGAPAGRPVHPSHRRSGSVTIERVGVVLFLIAAALTLGGVICGAKVLVEGRDPGLRDVEPDGRAVPLPADRPLAESDLERVRFDTALRGYRMDQVDAALARTAYDLGYKEELIRVLQAEVEALWAGRVAD